MKRTILILLFLLCLGFVVVLAISPQKWEVKNFDDFLQGQFKGISVNHEGKLNLAPKEEEITGPPEEFFLSLLYGTDGSIYLGTGHGGKLYRINKEGKPELYYKVPEMDITCLAQDSDGNIFVGTSPNGKIYKVTAKEKGEEFFNPREKYIWDLMLTGKGVILAAVGERGGIYEISPRGDGRMILDVQENHILCLNKMPNGNIIAGSGGKGAVYQLTPEGKSSLLYESDYEEVRSIVFDQEGNIYAAASGIPVKPKDKFKIQPSLQAADIEITVRASEASPTEDKSISVSGEQQPGALIKVNPQGIATKLWSSSKEMIYSLYWDSRSKSVLFGTGGEGRLYSVTDKGETSLFFQKDSQQIFLLYPSQDKIYLLANNPARLSVIQPQQRFDGEYLSRVFDAGMVSSWGKIEWEAEVPSGTVLQLQTRSGNSYEVNSSWSDWSPPYQKSTGESILSPAARYLQFKVIMKSQSGKVSPKIGKISMVYLQSNIAPAVSRITVFPPNQVYLKPPEQNDVIWGFEDKDWTNRKNKKGSPSLAVAKKAHRKGFQTIYWEASDENGDSLIYSIYVKKEDESQWRLFKDKWRENIYTMETATLPDGMYRVKVEASDAPSNPVNKALTAEKESSTFIIDNSLPVIKNFQARKSGNFLNISFDAEDSFSDIKEVKFLTRPDDWRVVFPVDGICDSKRESFNLKISIPPNSDGLITFKVVDAHHNVGVYRYTF